MVKKASFIFRKPKQKQRKGVHSKTKASKMKHSKNYLKKSRGQGK